MSTTTSNLGARGWSLYTDLTEDQLFWIKNWIIFKLISSEEKLWRRTNAKKCFFLFLTINLVISRWRNVLRKGFFFRYDWRWSILPTFYDQLLRWKIFDHRICTLVFNSICMKDKSMYSYVIYHADNASETWVSFLFGL